MITSPSFLPPQIPAYVVYSLTCFLGIFNHYIIPHLKKEMPWLCFSEPIVKAEEWDAFEVTGRCKGATAGSEPRLVGCCIGYILYGQEGVK